MRLKAMKDVALDTANNWVGMLFTGLGVSFAAHEWLGGMFLALAAAAFAMRKTDHTPNLLKVLLGAFIASHVGALIVHRYYPQIPVQIVMALIGLFSQPIMRIVFGVGEHVERKTDVLADRIVDKFLPDRKE